MTFSHSSFQGLIGVASADITPPVGIYARNWGAAKHDVAAGIHRPLFAKVVTFQTARDESPLVLITLDLGWWKTAEDEYFVRGAVLEEFNLLPEKVVLNLSHTHAGPGICREDGNLPGGELIAPYLQQVREAVVGITREALAAAETGVLEWAAGLCNLARNRDLTDPEKPRVVCGFNPEGGGDETVWVGRATSQSGKNLAVITNYACHPTTLAWQNNLISPDWCGAFHELIESTTGAISLFLQGASGELQARETYTGDTAIADAQGRQLGYAVLATLAGMLPAQTSLEYSGVVESGAPLATWRREVSAPNTNLNSQIKHVELQLKDLPSVQEIERDLEAATDRVTGERLTRKLRVRRHVGNGNSFDLPVTIWAVGDAIIVSQREECYSQFQTRLRNAFPNKAIIVMNLSNGSCGYLPPQELYDLDIYQVWQSPYERGGLEKLIIEAKSAIENL